MKYQHTLHTIFLLMVGFFATPVYAACTHVTMSNASFGIVTTQANITAHHLADISVTCDSSADRYLLGIDAGLHFSGSRQLVHADGAVIPYTLLQGSGGAELGDKNLTSSTYPQSAQAGSGTNIYPIYATANTQDKAPQGNFSDTITVTLADSFGKTLLLPITQRVTLDLVAFCTLDTSAVHGQFGNYPLGSNASISNINLGSLTVTCPNTIAYKIGMDKGEHLTGSVRQLALNGSLIPYTVKVGNGGAEWGDLGLSAIDSGYKETFATANAVAGTGTGVTQSFDVYGDASITNATAVGTYTDTLIVTLVW